MQSWQRSLDRSVQLTLRLALGGLSSLIVLAVFLLLFGSQYLGERLDTVHGERVVPLHSLQHLGYLLNVAQPLALDRDPGAVAAGWREIDQTWQGYLATFLAPEEAALARKASLQLGELREQTLEGSGTHALQAYRETLVPLNASLNALSDLKLRSGETALTEARSANRWAWACGVLIAGLGLTLIGLVVHLVSVRIVIPIRDSARALAALADGRTELPVDTARLQGEFGAVGEQLHRVQALLMERERLLAEEQEALRLLRSAQADLVEAEKLASLGGLVAGVTHELNTPLSMAVSLASDLRERSRCLADAMASGSTQHLQLDAYVEAVAEGAALIESNMMRAAELMRSFRQVAVDRTGMQRRYFNLAAMVDEVLVSLRPAYGLNGVELINELPPRLTMGGYPGALGQVLSNLVINAVVHGLNRRDGRVRVALESAPDANPLKLAVIDDGMGMSSAVQERLFEPFFSTRLGLGGTGLGLSIVRNIVVTVLGGRIGLRSSPGQGTTFTVELPREAPDASGMPDFSQRMAFSRGPAVEA